MNDELKKELEALSRHINSCPLCQSKDEVTANDEKEHEEWVQKYKTHIADCTKCKSAKAVTQMCKPIFRFITQDFREISGTRRFSQNRSYITRDGEKHISQRYYVNASDFNPENKLTTPERETLEQMGLDAQEFIPYSVDEFFEEKIPPEMEGILQYLLMGYKIGEIAEILGVSQPAITKKIKKLQKVVIKKPSLATISIGGRENEAK